MDEHVALALGRFPHFLQVVDALAPLVGQQRWRLAVTRFDPGREESPLVSLVPGQVNITAQQTQRGREGDLPEILVEVSIRYLLQGLHVVHWDQVAVQIHELDTNLNRTRSLNTCNILTITATGHLPL